MIPRWLHVPWFALSLAGILWWEIADGRAVWHHPVALIAGIAMACWVVACNGDRIR